MNLERLTRWINQFNYNNKDMNKEQLTRANELAERIEKLETQLVGWKHVACLRTTVLRCSLINLSLIHI